MPLQKSRSKSRDKDKDKKDKKKVAFKKSVKTSNKDGGISQNVKQSVNINIGSDAPPKRRRGRPRKTQAPVQAPPQQLVRQQPPIQEIFRPPPPLEPQFLTPSLRPPAPPMKPAVLGSVKAPSLNDRIGMSDEVRRPLLSKEELRERRLSAMEGRRAVSMFDDDVSVLSDEAVGSRSSDGSRSSNPFTVTSKRIMKYDGLGSEELDASEMIERITSDMSMSSAQRLKKIQELLQKMKDEEGSISSRGSDFTDFERTDADTGMLRSFPQSTINSKPSDLGFNKRNVDVMKTFKTAPLEGDFYNPVGEDYSVMKPRPQSEFIVPKSVRALKPRGRQVMREGEEPSEAELDFREPVVFNVEAKEYRMGRPFGSKDAQKRTRRLKITAEDEPPQLGAEEPPLEPMGLTPAVIPQRLTDIRDAEYRAKVSRQAMNIRDINDEIRRRSEKMGRPIDEAEREAVYNKYGETREGMLPFALQIARDREEFEKARDAPPSREPMRPNVMIYATEADLRDNGIKLSDEPPVESIVPMGQASLPQDEPPIDDVTFG
jgi:hypothetical protein